MRTWKLMACSLAIGLSGSIALAQEGKPKGAGSDQPPPPRAADGQGRGQGMGPRGAALSPEAAKAAWEAQANGVAKRLSLKDDQTKTLVKAYAEARQSHSAASEKMMTELRDKMTPDGDRAAMRRDMMKAVADLQKSEQEKFQKALGSGFSAEQTEKIMAGLGTFNRGWDVSVDKVLGLKLDAAKQQDVFNALEDLMAAQTKANAGAGGENFDREAATAARNEARKKFDDTVKAKLSADEYVKLQEAMPAGRGPGGGGAGGGGGGRNGPT